MRANLILKGRVFIHVRASLMQQHAGDGFLMRWVRRFSVMVLEASTSNRLVVYYPPLVSAGGVWLGQLVHAARVNRALWLEPDSAYLAAAAPPGCARVQAAKM